MVRNKKGNAIRYAKWSISGLIRITGFFSFVSLIIVLLLQSCKDEDHTAFPVIELVSGAGFIAGDTTIPAGETMRFRIIARDDLYNLTNFYIRVKAESERNVLDTGFNIPELFWEGSFIRNLESGQEWTFVIRDRWGNSAERSILIGLDTGAQFNPLVEKKDLLLGAQQNNSNGSFYSIGNDRVYFTMECDSDPSIQKVLDLVHYYGPDLSTLASPGANIEAGIFESDLSGWTYRNTTRFLPMGITAEEFEQYDNDSILITSYDDSQAKRKAKALKAGDIYVFKTQDGTLGMFLVREVTEGEQGSVLLDLKTRER